MKIMVTGGRRYENSDAVRAELDYEHAKSPVELIVGDATGADAHARAWAEDRGIKPRVFYAYWREEGPAAGPLRNQRMVDEAPDLCLAFPGGKGTADAVARCIKAGIPVRKL